MAFANLRRSSNYLFKLYNKGQITRLFHDEFSNPVPDPKYVTNKNPQVLSKYKVFRDEDSSVIFDVEEQKMQSIKEAPLDIDYDRYQGINLDRGIHEVFDIDDLVQVLRKESAEDIFVCTVPKELKYVDYMVVVTGRSVRHMTAIVEFVRRVYKLKRHKSDIIPRIEGETSRDWKAMDLGNIALHVFSENSRKIYDLESLWCIGSEFDRECNKQDEDIVKLFERNSIYLSDLTGKAAKESS